MGTAGRTSRGAASELGLQSSPDWPVCLPGHCPTPVITASTPAAIALQQGPEEPENQRWRKREKQPPPPIFCFFLAGLVFVFFVLFFFLIQPLCGPIRGLLPPPTSSLVAVTRQTFLVVTAGLVELGSSTGMVFKKRVSQTTATLNSNAA